MRRRPSASRDLTVFRTAISDTLVIHTAHDAVTLDDIFATMKAWFDHVNFDPEKPVLWDLREASFDATQREISGWAESMLEATNRARAGRKTAWVLPTSEIAQFAVDLVSSYDFKNRVRIYQNDYEAAHAWLTTTIR